MSGAVRCTAFLLAVAALTWPLAGRPVENVQIPIGPDLGGLGWQVHAFDGIPPTVFSATATGTLQVRADHSASVLYRRLDDVGIDGGRVLTWEWQVVEGLPASDLSLPDGEDRPLAVHVWFYPADGDGVGMLERLGAAFGKPPGKVLTYVWGGDRAPGSMFVNPHNRESGRMITLRRAGARTGEWFRERVDLAADYARAFGGMATKPAAIAVSADADDLASMSLALLRNLRFTVR
jgi:hypothetical protein